MTSVIVTKKTLEKEAKDYDAVYLLKDFNFKAPTRKNFESKKHCFIKDVELVEKKDNLHYRQSGINQVLGRLAKNKTIFFNLNLLKKKQSLTTEVILGRMMMNIRLCRKFKVKMAAGFICSSKYSIKNSSDIISFLQTIGMTPKEAQTALEF